MLAVFLGVQAWQTRAVPQGAAPDLVLTLVGPDGRTQATTLSQWRAMHPGQAVGVYVWAEWCPICRSMQGTVTGLQADQPVLTIAMQSGPPEAVARYLRQRSLPWQTAVDAQGTLARELGFKAVPGFVVIDAEGRLRAPTVGFTTSWGLRARLWWARWN